MRETGTTVDYSRAVGTTAETRAAFIRRTYGHLAGAILLFMVLESLLLAIPGIEVLVYRMLSGFSWLIVLGLFMFVSYIANKWAYSDKSMEMQYLGLGLYVAAEAVIFLPILFIASSYFPGIISQAAFMTVVLFTGLTWIVITTKKDFSFLRGILSMGFLIMLGVIVVSILFGFNLGILFSSIMILLAAGSILYTTSAIQRHFRPSQHVAASLALFASVALMFWYILQILMAFSGRD